MIIQTQRLTLQPITDNDRAAILGILTNDVVKRTYMLPDFASEDEAKRLFVRLKELSFASSRYVRGIFLGSLLVGFINDVGIHGTSIELGWVLHPAYHNRGYATEAVGAAMDDLFARGYTRIDAGAFEENTASIRVMEKCGMERTDRSEEIHYRGKTHHCVYYTKKQ